jgi:putative NIF3 family GTP cyclohydrolase 1 type 2
MTDVLSPPPPRHHLKGALYTPGHSVAADAAAASASVYFSPAVTSLLRAPAVGGPSSESERLLADKLSRAEAVLLNAEREYSRAMSSIAEEREKLATERQAERDRLGLAEDRAAFLLQESSGLRSQVETLRQQVATANERAAAQVFGQLENESTLRKDAEDKLAKLQRESTDVRAKADEAVRKIQAIEAHLEVVTAQRDALVRGDRDHHVDVLMNRERTTRLTVLLNESEGRSTVWELAARYLSATAAIAHASVVQLQGAEHVLTSGYLSRHSSIIPTPFSPDHEGGSVTPQRQPLATSLGTPMPTGTFTLTASAPESALVHYDSPQRTSSPRAMQASVVLAARVRELERSLANSMTDLERERVAAKELRGALEQLNSLLLLDGGRSSTATPQGGDPAGRSKVRDSVASLLTAGELAKAKSDLEIERAHREALHAAQGKMALQLRESTEECAKLNHECEALTSAVRKLQSEQRRDRSDFAALELKSADAERANDQLSSDLANEHAQLAKYRSLEAQLQQDLHVAVDTNARLLKDLEAATAKAARSTESEALRLEIVALSAELESSRASQERQTQRLREQGTTSIPLQEHNDTVAELKAKIAALERRAVSLEEQGRDTATIAARAVEDQRQLTEARSTITKLEDALRNANLRSQDSATAQVQQAAAFQEKFEAFASENATLRFQLHSSQQRLLHLQAQYTEAQRGYERELRDALDSGSGSATERETFLASQLLTAADEIERLQYERNDLVAELEQREAPVRSHDLAGRGPRKPETPPRPERPGVTLTSHPAAKIASVEARSPQPTRR